MQIDSSIRFSDVEHAIWDCIRRDDMTHIIELSKRAYGGWKADGTTISPLTQFMLVKRMCSVDGILAGIYATMQTEMRGDLDDCTMLFAALLADQDVGLLMRSLSAHDMVKQAFMVFRDAESRTAWTTTGKFTATESIYAVLADSLARTDDIRAITFLTRTALRSGVTASVHYYTAIICGLTRKGKPAQMGEFFLRKTQVADSLLADMKRCNIKRPAKVYHSLMYAWAILKQPKQVRAYFEELCMLQSSESSSGILVSEVTWGILMYAYVRSGDVAGVMSVLREASEWLLSNSQRSPSAVDAESCTEHARTSYLLNMAMSSLLSAKDPHTALSLLDENISQPTALHASSGDPVTLNLIMRALLSDKQLPKALSVYDQIHAQYELPESPSDLTMVLRYCIQTSDVNGAFALVGRIMQTGASLTDHQWHAFMRLCVYKCSPDTVLYIYDQICKLAGVDGIKDVPKLLVRFPDIADWVCTAMEDMKRIADARTVRRSLSSTDSSLLLPPVKSIAVQTNRAKCLSLYRGLLRQVRGFPIPEMRAKLKHNARFTFELYRDLPTNDPQIARLVDEGQSQIKWLQGWHADGGQLLVRKESR
ncbi:hypothetical protein DL89DRAFT_293954 [Linderina pennispora]|uniref:Complex 1 LYR protein domain-containing protein n=1 Tax=Linderina pennispora TaxID=61395 RepID=A0A1Y1W683_9FUNG|nr:uncharacterized protein DL89DRAFT_293954 [Linderina pennispora]ORX68756.1 hypothetical protein DL89DRAFT_293954 [Linderina pennispora]